MKPVLEVLQATTEYFAKHGVESPRLKALFSPALLPEPEGRLPPLQQIVSGMRFCSLCGRALPQRQLLQFLPDRSQPLYGKTTWATPARAMNFYRFPRRPPFSISPYLQFSFSLRGFDEPAFALASAFSCTASSVCSAAPGAKLRPARRAEFRAAPASAYSLPPDKLAKAVVLARIRIALEIAGTLWGIGFVWLLLAKGRAARFAGWLEQRIRRRWLQGLAFFAAYLLVSTLASLPLDVVGHAVGLHYGISVQGWLSWTGDQAKGLGLGLLLRQR